MKRYISCLLVLVLLMTLVPFSAFAESSKDITMQASPEIRDLIKKYEGCMLTAYQDVYGIWTIGYGHTGYVPCRGQNVCAGMTLTKQEAEDLLLNDLNEIYAPSVNKFVNSHRNLYPNGFTQYEFDVLVSLAFGFGAYWIDYYKDQYRLAKYLLNGIHNYSDAEIADAIVCLWSGLNGLLTRRMEEARIFLYGDYKGTGPNQLIYLKFDGAATVFSEDGRSGNKVACYIKGAPYGELPTAKDSSSGYFAGWKTSGGKVLKNTDIATESQTVSATWSSTKPNTPTTYKLSVINGSGSGMYSAGTVVKLTPDTKSGLEFTGWSGDVTPVKKSDGYYVTMPSKNITVTANFAASKCKYGTSCPSKSFADVPSTFWAHAQIDNVVSMKLFNGTSTTSFAPDMEMNRGMLVTVLYRLAGSPSVSELTNDFPDVAKNSYYNAILWAHANNIAHGFSDGTFRPDEPISREQFATFLQRFAANIYKMDTESANYANLSKFTDANEVDQAYRESMSWAVGEGIINGTSATTLSPNDGATRAQVAVILTRFTSNT
ncbi:MAG: S-layer homology domain-containing protein [Bacillota bacterium]|nr:S-layer homology domain-containing protein [Bacillota bacterium]